MSRQLISENEEIVEKCGTPAYIAPEILSGKVYSGFKSDMWSAGVCLYVMLVGTVPFRAESIEELQLLILKGKYELEKQFLTAECKDILQSLMEIDPTKRLSACEALSHPWLLNGNEKIDLCKSDLQDIIFTEKEK